MFIIVQCDVCGFAPPADDWLDLDAKYINNILYNCDWIVEDDGGGHTRHICPACREKEEANK